MNLPGAPARAASSSVADSGLRYAPYASAQMTTSPIVAASNRSRSLVPQIIASSVAPQRAHRFHTRRAPRRHKARNESHEQHDERDRDHRRRVRRADTVEHFGDEAA